MFGKRVPAASGRLWLVLLLIGGCVLSSRGVTAAELNRSVPVTRGTRLDVRLFGGEVTVRAWNRDTVRLRATHFKTDVIDIRATKQAVTVRARSRLGTPHAIDLTIDAPAWMPIAVAGTYVDISIAGTRAGITAETVRGDVTVKGGAGEITLKSIEGEVVLEDAEGRAALTAVNNGIRVTGLKGELLAETVNGSVTLRDVRSSSVEVGTMAGEISWEGPLDGAGHYLFATHDGDIDVTLGARPDAVVSVRAGDGQFRSTYGATVPTDRLARKRFRFGLGTGAAHLDLETFRGTISLRQPAASSTSSSR